jgi:membrane protease YdiL (CAAX protease family)
MTLLFYRLFYVIIILSIDCLATTHSSFLGIEWRIFSWHFPMLFESAIYPLSLFSSFDFFKFIFWFIFPLIFTFFSLPKGNKLSQLKPWINFRLQKKEALFLGFLFLLGLFTVLSIYWIPELRDYYPSQNHLRSSEKFVFFQKYLLWTFSWLLGWEFLFRYYLISQVINQKKNIQYFFLLFIPCIESLYHVFQNKSSIESLGVFAFSLIATTWCIQKRTLTLPFLAHLFIELSLVSYLLLF